MNSATMVGSQATMKFVDLSRGSKFLLSQNRTNVLTFPSVSPHHSGKYMCHVSNGIGRPLHQIVTLTVKGIIEKP